MFFIYFPCALLTSIVVYFDSVKQKMPMWWSPLVFFAPAVTPLYLIKTRKKKSLLSISMFLLIFSLVIVGEAFFFSNMKEKKVLESHSPAVREVIGMADLIADLVEYINTYTEKLEDSSGVGASPDSIYETLKFVKSMQVLMKDHSDAVANFNGAAREYRNRLKAENLTWMLSLERYYRDRVVIKYLKSLALYLQAFISLLEYTAEHFDEIQARDVKYRKNYDSYYMKYVRALDRHDRIDVVRMRYQHNFVRKYPQLSPYLPRILETRFVNIWKK